MANYFIKDLSKFYESSDILQDFRREENQPYAIQEFFEKETDFFQKELPKRDILLDAGCGWGVHLKILANKYEYLFGIDKDKKRILKAKEELTDFNNIQILHADIYDIPFRDNYFDIILCTNNTFGNLPSHKAALAEMLRVLKNQGKIYLSLHGPKMVKDKITFYQNVGLSNPKVLTDHIVTDEGFYSYFFSKEFLANIFEPFSINYEILDLTTKSYICILTKINQEEEAICHGK